MYVRIITSFGNAVEEELHAHSNPNQFLIFHTDKSVVNASDDELRSGDMNKDMLCKLYRYSMSQVSYLFVLLHLAVALIGRD